MSSGLSGSFLDAVGYCWERLPGSDDVYFWHWRFLFVSEKQAFQRHMMLPCWELCVSTTDQISFQVFYGISQTVQTFVWFVWAIWPLFLTLSRVKVTWGRENVYCSASLETLDPVTVSNAFVRFDMCKRTKALFSHKGESAVKKRKYWYLRIKGFNCWCACSVRHWWCVLISSIVSLCGIMKSNVALMSGRSRQRQVGSNLLVVCTFAKVKEWAWSWSGCRNPLLSRHSPMSLMTKCRGDTFWQVTCSSTHTRSKNLWSFWLPSWSGWSALFPGTDWVQSPAFSLLSQLTNQLSVRLSCFSAYREMHSSTIPSNFQPVNKADFHPRC